MKAPIKIFSGSNSEYLAGEIAKAAGLQLGKSSITRFSDGEFEVCYEETVRGAQVFIIQSTYPPTDNLMELLLMIDAAKRASAYKVIAVIPYFGFARQDRKDRPRVAIGAKLVANLLMAAGVDRVMTMDLHADQIQGFFDIPVDHLYGSSVLLPYIENLKLDNLVVASPDMGGSKRANTYAKYLNAGLAICHKSREKANVVGEMTAIGDVDGRHVVIVDDMIDTAGTITKAANMLKEKGALSVRAIATHAVLSGPAYERIKESALEEVVFTDSIPLKKEVSKIKELTIADIFAKTILNVYNCESISSNFIL
ncbi:ribose-phosphate pyrophosphokinase [Labilibaculum euxinus]